MFSRQGSRASRHRGFWWKLPHIQLLKSGQTITKGVPRENKRLSSHENKPVPKEPSIIDMDL